MADVFERLKAVLAERYAVERELGAGGMATVYLAEDLRHHRKVALKVLRAEISATLGPGRFSREIAIAARLQHPNILPLLDSGEADGFSFYVMPYVEGESVRERLARSGEFAIPDAARILLEVADALSHAHAQGVVHRDIKPDNVLLSGRHALVADFGVAKAVTQATGYEALTSTGVALGTPAYMAPEQAVADPRQDHRVDIYALGVLGYELLTGRAPFAATTAQEMLAAHVTADPEPLDRHRPSVPPALSQVVMKCLAKKPADRWQTADELVARLEPLATPSGGSTPTQTHPVPVSRRIARWVPWAGGAAGLAVGAVLLILLLKPKPLAIAISDIEPVSSEPAVEFEPAISPDGKEVAFVTGPVTAPHVVVRSATATVGSGEVTMADSSLRSQWVPTWSPDGEFIRFMGCRKAGWWGCSWYEISRHGGAIRPVSFRPGVSFPSPAWSTSGRVAFFAGDTVFAAPAAGIAPQPIAIQPQEEIVGLHSPVWSPDEMLIAYVDGNPLWRFTGNIGSSSIWVVNADGGEPRRVTTEDYLNTSPTWLDPRHLLFVSNRDGPNAVYVVEVTPRGPRGEPRLVPGVVDPHWISYSIPARRLVYSKLTLRQNIWSFPVGRSAPVSVREGTPVTNGNQVIEEHDVSPDGRWIAFDNNRRGNLDLYKMSLASGEVVPLTDAPGDEQNPRWSPDGREIAFYYRPLSSHFTYNIGVIGADGVAPTPVASNLGTLNFTAWSPDGLAIAFSMVSGKGDHYSAWLSERDSLRGQWHEPKRFSDENWLVSEWTPDGSAVLCLHQLRSELALVMRDGRIRWRQDMLSTNHMHADLWGLPRFSRDGSTIYFAGTHEAGRRGIWAIPAAGGPARLVVRFDDPTLAAQGFVSLGPDRLYVTVSQYDSDIWTLSLRQ